MSSFIAAFLLLLGMGRMGAGPAGQPFIPPTTERPPGYLCLDSIPDREPGLLNIPKPEINGWMDAESCEREGCGGDYETADYILVTTDVLLPEIWPYPQTTRLMKQKNGIPENLKDRVYRPSCNDWCWLCNDFFEDPPCSRSGFMPYGGSFHCDFVWLLKENAPMREIDGELYPEDRFCNLNEDPLNLEGHCPLFDVYIREGAKIPEIARCNKQSSDNAGDIDEGASGVQRVFAQGGGSESFVEVEGTRWIIAHDPLINPKRLVNWDMRGESEGRVLVLDDEGEPLEVAFRGVNYHAYHNLTNKLDLKYGDRYLYLVESWFDDGYGTYRDYVMVADEYPLDQYFAFVYLEFRRSEEINPEGKTLQLGTFFPFKGELRWHWWADESKPAIYLYPEEPTQLTVKLKPAGYITVSDPPYDEEKGWEVVAYPDGTLVSTRLLGIFSSGRSQESTSKFDSTSSCSLRENLGELSSDQENVSPKFSIPCEKVLSQSRLGSTHTNIATYPYLFYEAKLEKVYTTNEGFVVAGKNLRGWFGEILPKIGLNQRETADFVEYWLGRLDEEQPYYFVHFLSEEQIEELEPLEISVKPDTIIRLRAFFEPLERKKKIETQILPVPPVRRGFTVVEWGGILAAKF